MVRKLKQIKQSPRADNKPQSFFSRHLSRFSGMLGKKVSRESSMAHIESSYHKFMALMVSENYNAAKLFARDFGNYEGKVHPDHALLLEKFEKTHGSFEDLNTNQLKSLATLMEKIRTEHHTKQSKIPSGAKLRTA